MIAISFTLGLRQLPQRQRPGFYARSSFRDAQLPAGLCAVRFGGAITAVTGYTKNSIRGVANNWRGIWRGLPAPLPMNWTLDEHQDGGGAEA
jgi:hypothetical protein